MRVLLPVAYPYHVNAVSLNICHCAQVAPMSLAAYVQQSSLRRAHDGSLLQPSARLHLHR